MEENDEFLNKPIKMTGFSESFRAGWNEWKNNGEEKEETSFSIFKNSMNDELSLGNP